MSWISLIFSVLSFLRWMIEEGQKRQWITEGEEREIARNTAEILRKTQVGREIWDRISKLNDSALDDELRKLEE